MTLVLTHVGDVTLVQAANATGAILPGTKMRQYWTRPSEFTTGLVCSICHNSFHIYHAHCFTFQDPTTTEAQTLIRQFNSLSHQIENSLEVTPKDLPELSDIHRKIINSGNFVIGLRDPEAVVPGCKTLANEKRDSTPQPGTNLKDFKLGVLVGVVMMLVIAATLLALRHLMQEIYRESLWAWEAMETLMPMILKPLDRVLST